MTPKQLTQLLSHAIPAGLPILITGAPGTGKSDIVAKAAEAAGADLILSHPAVADPTDAKGLPWAEPGAKEATFLPFGELAAASKATKQTVWFLDDLGQASPAVQASFMQLLLARRVNGHRLPDCVTFVAATNRRTDKAGVSGILEPVKSRFGSIVNLDPSLDDWCQWAYNNNVPPMLIAFLRFRPDLLSKFEATADLTNSPCPRTWANLGRVEALGLPAEIESAAFAGSVGEGAAVEYLGFRTVASQLQSIDSILLDPKRARVPKQPNQLYAISVGLAAKATTSNIGRVIQYCQRLFEEKHGEFAALIMRDSVRREPKIEYCQDYQNAAFTELGQLITGGVS